MNRIDGLNPLATSRTLSGQGANGVEGSRDRDGSQAADGVSSGLDNVNLSRRGRIVAEAARAVHQAPDVRADRVAALKAAIADGTYSSDSREIAARLLATGTFGE
ncbi:MAG: flagellar biosynthesis anti-sigma factor FlgM [Hyphomicrobiales bacterium]